MDKQNKSNIFLKEKRLREKEIFTNRIESLIELPNEIISKYTNYSFIEDNSFPLCLVKDNFEFKNYMDNTKIDLNNEVTELKEEIDEIVNELEIFARHNRKQRMIKLMEKIVDNINDDLFEIDELIDYHLFGNTIKNIESEYTEAQKRKYINNIKLCEYTNKLLMDDDKIYNKNNCEN